jgi:hypothetical protein
MGKDTKTVAATPTGLKPGDVQIPQPRSMSLEKAKKLIRKTSDEHKGLFRRLAK